MPWSLATFLRNFSWQSDRDLGIRIRADRMDGEFDNFKGGMEQLLLRSGANSPEADINWAGHKIINLANGAASGDAVNLSQMQAADTTIADAAAAAAADADAALLAAASINNGGWVLEAGTPTFVAVNQFSIPTDLTTTYHVGRRVKVTHNAGVIITGTVSAVAFAAGATTVTVETDNASNLVTPVTAVAFGLIEYTSSPYLSPRTVFAGVTTAQVPITANVVTVVSQGASWAVRLDTLGEAFSGGWKARFTGNYLISAQISFDNNFGTLGTLYYFRALLDLSGPGGGSIADTSMYIGGGTNLFNVSIPAATYALPKGAIVNLRVLAGANCQIANSNAGAKVMITYLSIVRVP